MQQLPGCFARGVTATRAMEAPKSETGNGGLTGAATWSPTSSMSEISIAGCSAGAEAGNDGLTTKVMGSVTAIKCKQ